MAKYQFEKGNKYSRGGKKGNKGGRPTKQQQEIKRMAAALAKKYLEDNLKVVLNTYISLATGKRTGKSRRTLDPATTRHYVERFLGPAPRTLTLDLEDSVESFFEKVISGKDTHEDRDEEKS